MDSTMIDYIVEMVCVRRAENAMEHNTIKRFSQGNAIFSAVEPCGE